MPPAKLSREDAIDRIADLFRAHGYEGASLSLVSDATGLGRASLYHHFPDGKDEMVRAVFARLGAKLEAELLAPLRGKGKPAERLGRWAKGIEAFYACGDKNCLLGALVLSGGAGRFPAELRGSFRALIDGLAVPLVEAGLPRAVARRRAEDAIARIQGALVVGRGLGDRSVFRRLIRELPSSLLAKDT